MELEDLFRKQRPPKDYVSYPPQETPTLEKFFAERTPKQAPSDEGYNMFGREFLNKSKLSGGVKEVVNPVKPEIAEVAAKSDKISSDRVAEIRAVLSPVMQQEAQVAPQANPPGVYDTDITQTQETPVSRSDLIDVAKVRRQAEELTPQASWGDVAMGAIPLLVSQLMGGGGAGYEVAGDYLMGKANNLEKRKQSLEDKLMEIEKSRAIASQKQQAKSGIKTVETVGPDGKPIITEVSQAIGKEAWKKPEDNWQEKEAFKAQLKAQLQGQKLTAKQRDDIISREMALADDWSKDEFTKNTYKAADAFKRISSINPESADPVEDMGAIFDLMKMLDPQSVVRESEQAMAMGARSYDDVVNNFESILSKKRKLTPDQVRNIKKFASRLYTLRKESQDQIDEGYRGKARNYGLNADNIVQKIGSGTPLLWKNTKTGKYDIIVLPENEVDGAIKLGAQRVK